MCLLTIVFALLSVPLAVLADDGATRLTFVGNAANPVWSPGNGMIAFDRYPSGDWYSQVTSGVWVIPSTGGTATPFVPHSIDGSTELFAHSPSWSPDGSNIACVHGMHNLVFPDYIETDVWVYSYPDGGASPVWVANVYNSGVGPSWSPDGNLIALVQFGVSGVTGGDILTTPAPPLPSALTLVEAGAARPSWSPDNTWIAFEREEDPFAGWDIWVVPASGGFSMPSYCGGRYPAWSPDGSQIAFAKETDGNWDIWTRPANWSFPAPPPTRITSDPAKDIQPCWSPDGSQIAFCSDRSGDEEIWVIDVPGPIALDRESWGSIKVKYRE